VALRVGRVLGYVALELGCQPNEPSDVASPARMRMHTCACVCGVAASFAQQRDNETTGRTYA
jgi:hypothetical protein